MDEEDEVDEEDEEDEVDEEDKEEVACKDPLKPGNLLRQNISSVQPAVRRR